MNVELSRSRLDDLMATGLMSGFVSALVSTGMPVEHAEAAGVEFRNALFRNWPMVSGLTEKFLTEPPHTTDIAVDMGVIL